MVAWGFTYKGIHSSTKGLEIVDIKGRTIMPGVNSKNFTVPSMHGQHYFGFRYDKRELDVTVLLNSTSINTFRDSNRDLAIWLNPLAGLSDLIFDDEPTKKYKAVVTNTQDWNQTKAWGTSEIRFICPDPFAYSTTPRTQTSSSGSFVVNNGGAVEVAPKFTFTLTSSAAQLKVAIGTLYVNLITSFAISDVVIVDCETGLITKNGTDIRNTMDILSDFPSLQPGNNTVTLTPSTGKSTTVDFTERWI